MMRNVLGLQVFHANFNIQIRMNAHQHKNISIAAVFIDMYSAIDMLNFKYRNLANTRSVQFSSVIFRVA